MLETVIAQLVDTRPAIRKRMLSAILMGGNVLVKGNTGIGAAFQHIPACRRTTQLGCMIGGGLLNVIQPSAPFAPGSTIALGLSVVNCSTPTYRSATSSRS